MAVGERTPASATSLLLYICHCQIRYHYLFLCMYTSYFSSLLYNCPSLSYVIDEAVRFIIRLCNGITVRFSVIDRTNNFKIRSTNDS